MPTTFYSAIISSSTSRLLTIFQNINDHLYVMNSFEDKWLSDGGLFLTRIWRGPRNRKLLKFRICRLRGGNVYILLDIYGM
jgi:hypothetical protein